MTGLDVREAAHLPAAEVLACLGTRPEGLSPDEAAARLATVGPNTVVAGRARAVEVFGRQLHNPLLGLLVAAATVSFFVGERSDAVIIGVIVALSIGLGFANEYRAERAAAALEERLRYRATVCRGGTWMVVDATELVPGDVVRVEPGSVVPADLRILAAAGLSCDEAILTGEAVPAEKDPSPAAPGAALAELSCCAFAGTVVRSGWGEGVVVATGAHTVLGRMTVALGERRDETEFQIGLRRFSALLARVAGVLTASIFVTNLVLARPIIDALLFSLAIAVGITPQLLPAVVTTSLATGSRRLAARKVLVKRLVVIEDLGDIEVLLTDKTGTLTEGRLSFREAVDPWGNPDRRVVVAGLACTDATLDATGRPVDPDPLDAALWQAAGDEAAAYRRVAVAPFDHSRRRISVLLDGPDGRIIVTKGAPEELLERCRHVPEAAREVLAARLRAGARVVAVAMRQAPELRTVTPTDEHDLDLVGFLVFADVPKPSARTALARLAELGITVRVLTGDHPAVAEAVCDALGLHGGLTLTGTEVDRLSDDELMALAPRVRIFARMDPEQKTRVIRLHRHAGCDVAYLGDGVNDAVGLHAASVGISVEGATDVARDAADIVLLEKDLGVLADGVVEGRRIFANTIKYVLMGTSSNFGNMFSAAAASAFLPFLPMLPSQVLLNNLLYDLSQLTIPTDRVDDEQLARPSHWDVGFIRRFMVTFGPLSSLFDFVTFAVMLKVFDAGPSLFRTGWFVESLATQSLVIFVIRTRRVPFWRSPPGRLLTVATLTVVALGTALPYSPFGRPLGFRPLPAAFFGVLVLMVGAYLALVEGAIGEFYAHIAGPVPGPRRR